MLPQITETDIITIVYCTYCIKTLIQPINIWLKWYTMPELHYYEKIDGLFNKFHIKMSLDSVAYFVHVWHLNLKTISIVTPNESISCYLTSNSISNDH